MGSKARWTSSGTSGQIFSLDGERLFYITMADGWQDQSRANSARILSLLNQADPPRVLTCDGPIGKSDRSSCAEPVTHIDEKGYVYCRDCGNDRKQSHRCRKLTAGELKQLRAGKPLANY